jgi:predicted Rossmann-fold nucleotide-binding protein
MTSTRICVYCASSDLCHEKFHMAGQRLGNALARMNMTVVYGGSQTGVMGALANGALQSQGNVIGWIPKFMPNEIQHRG